MLREILDQRFGKAPAIAGNRHRQVDHRRVARVRLGRQPVAAVQAVHIQRDPCPSGDHAVIVAGGEGQRHLAARPRLDRTGHGHLGRGVGQDRDLPVAAARPGNADPAGAHDDKALVRGGPRPGVGGPVRHRLVQGQRPDLAIKPRGHAAAIGDGQRARRHVVEIDRRQAGIARRLDPAFPGRPRDRRRAAAGGDPGDRSDTPDRPEKQRDRKGDRRHETQPVGVAPGDAQVGAHRAGVGDAARHAVLMRAPDQGRAGVVGADRLMVQNRADRLARQGRVKARQRLVPGRPAKPPHPPGQGRQCGQAGRDQTGQNRLGRHDVLQAQHQRRRDGQQHRDQRPERPPRPLGHQPGAGQRQRPAQASQDRRGAGAGA